MTVQLRLIRAWADAVVYTLLLLCIGSAWAAEEELSSLANDRVWRALLHYETPGVWASRSSTILAGRFFLAPDGNRDPLSELKLSIKAMTEVVDDPDQHGQCRFPARYIWLRRHIPAIQNTPVVNCSGYQDWLNAESIGSVSMVFATGHMKSPASFFGHNFLKYNSRGASGSGDLLDPTINFGAEVPDDTDTLSYFYNGISGGYSAVFERQPFFKHMAAYGEEDLRDVWEYELNLSEAELSLLLAHTWELQNAELNYFFFRKNCAYQIAKLLAVVTPAQLVPKYMPWTMPYNVFERLVRVGTADNPLVSNIRYHPSRRSRFHRRYYGLSEDERAIFKQQIVQRLILDTVQFESLQLISKFAIIDALIDYYEFRLRLDKDDSEAAEEKKQLLIKRFALPVAESRDAEGDLPLQPHLAQRPGYLAFSAVDNNAIGVLNKLRIRPAYFDFLAHDIGRSTSGEFLLLDTELVFDESDVTIGKFDLINITNLAPSITGIPGDNGTSWHWRLGVDKTNDACKRCQRLMMDLQLGKSSSLSRGFTGFLMAGGRVQKRYKEDSPFVIRVSAGVTGALTPRMRVHATVERHEDLGSSGRDRNRISVDLALGLRRNWDIRFGYAREITEQVSISAGFFW